MKTDGSNDMIIIQKKTNGWPGQSYGDLAEQVEGKSEAGQSGPKLGCASTKFKGSLWS